MNVIQAEDRLNRYVHFHLHSIFNQKPGIMNMNLQSFLFTYL